MLENNFFIVLRVSDNSHWLNANIGLKLAKNAQKWCKNNFKKWLTDTK
jgi:hypothetical protein